MRRTTSRFRYGSSDPLSFFCVPRAIFHERLDRGEPGRRELPIEYANFVIMLVIALGIGVLAVLVSALLGPKKASRAKLMAYESGNDPEHGGVGTGQRFPVHFYLVAMLFIIFDIETVFMIPWAVAFRQLGDMAGLLIIEMLVFMTAHQARIPTAEGMLGT